MSNNTYNQIPYISNPFFKSHPAYLKSILALCNIRSAPIETARVLEIGCSMGGNIIPLAIQYPQMNIVGIDLSSVQVEKGNEIIQKMGLKNIVLINADISQVTCDDGLFDYIICHGVFSWVPPAVQESILALIEKALSPTGMAFVSYNTYPGWHTSIAYRDIALFQDLPTETAETRYQNMMTTFGFLKDTVPSSTPLGTALDNNYDSLTQQPSYYMLHEYLEPCNMPLYFMQFNNMLKKHNLLHLVDADFLPQFNYPSHLTQEQIAQLQSLANGDVIYEEQLKDFINNRHFRQSVITRLNNFNNMKDMPNEWLNLHIASNLTKREDEEGMVSYYHNEKKLADDPSTRFILDYIFDKKLSTTPVSEIYQAFQKSYPEISINSFFSSIALLAAAADITLRPHCVKVNDTFHEKPYIPASYRSLAEHLITHDDINFANCYHHIISFTPIEKIFMTLCDGKHSLAEIIDHIIQGVENGNYTLEVTHDNSQAITSIPDFSQKELRHILNEQLINLLNYLAHNGFLDTSTIDDQIMPDMKKEMSTTQKNKNEHKKQKKNKKMKGSKKALKK
ncbi:hypothetical protein A6A19_03820 [Actinobacillus delphinicola]|uniref:class I SAM-dependent methyltransferase n=1 Tax=Actinobacillus delphinicola TaxID=51161 RepID=UPI002442369A|nr:class I SAM-dependent methyltransferase [Actinobacillus delphinicola]MDG6897146.1 hypothetical protein [Actinobacillus delphinicola]